MAMDSNATDGNASGRRWPSLSLAAVSTHRSSTDCYVVVHGRVIDVSSFLTQHPGGAAALSKEGRGGCDVTEHFDRIGHSSAAWSKLLTMQVGELDLHGDAPPSSSSSSSSSAAVGGPIDQETYAVEWHGARRRAILKAHPEVAALQGHNSLTPLLGVGVGLLHAAACVMVQRWGSGLGVPSGLGLMLALAATVGAWCKMAQFAVSHDLCHGTAGAWCRGPLARHACLHLCTLPSVGGETHQYYTLQHLGHHAALGDRSIINGAPPPPPLGVPRAKTAPAVMAVMADAGAGAQAVAVPVARVEAVEAVAVEAVAVAVVATPPADEGEGTQSPASSPESSAREGEQEQQHEEEQQRDGDQLLSTSASSSASASAMEAGLEPGLEPGLEAGLPAFSKSERRMLHSS